MMEESLSRALTMPVVSEIQEMSMHQARKRTTGPARRMENSIPSGVRTIRELERPLDIPPSHGVPCQAGAGLGEEEDKQQEFGNAEADLDRIGEYWFVVLGKERLDQTG